MRVEPHREAQNSVANRKMCASVQEWSVQPGRQCSVPGHSSATLEMTVRHFETRHPTRPREGLLLAATSAASTSAPIAVLEFPTGRVPSLRLQAAA